MTLSQMEKTELRNRIRGLRDDELQYVVKCIPSEVIMSELSRRESVVLDTMTEFCNTWDDLTIDKPFDEMTLIEKQKMLKELRRVLYYGE